MPPPLVCLRRHLHRVQDIRNFPETKSLLPQLTHFKNGLLFSLMLRTASFLDLLPIGQSPYPFLVGSSLPDRDSMDLEILQNSGSGGKNLYCNFLATEPFFEVFLLEEKLILVRWIF